MIFRCYLVFTMYYYVKKLDTGLCTLCNVRPVVITKSIAHQALHPLISMDCKIRIQVCIMLYYGKPLHCADPCPIVHCGE